MSGRQARSEKGTEGGDAQRQLNRLMSEHIAMVGDYIQARQRRDQPATDKVRDALLGPMAKEWGTFWTSILEPPKGMTLQRFQMQLTKDMEYHITTTASYVEDIVHNVSATQAIRTAHKHGRDMGAMLDKAKLRGQ